MDSISTHPAPVTKAFGAITIVANRTVDGGYAINTFTGPIREANLCFTTHDRALYRRVYAVIGEGGNNGVSPEGIHQALTDELTRDLHTAQRRRDGRQIELLNAALDRLDNPAQAEADRHALADIAETIRNGRPARELSGFGKFKAAHQQALADDRVARQQPVLFGEAA